MSEVNSKEEVPETAKVYYSKYARAVEKAKEKLGNYDYEVEEVAYNTIRDMGLYGANQFELITENDFRFVLEASNEMDASNFKIIYEFEVEEEFEVNDKAPDTYSIYINGVDFSGTRRDYNLLATINTKTHKVVLTSIPRDYYIDIPAYGAKESLTNLGGVEPEIPKEALEQLFDTKIDYTLNLYTTTLVKVVDAIGGVDFCSSTNFYTTHDLNIGSYDDTGEKLYVRKGCYQYNGAEILAIARERLHIPNYERGRQDNCRQILINIVKKLTTMTTLTNYSEILNSFEGLYTTNINQRMIKNLLKAVIEDPNFEIIEQKVDGRDGQTINHWGNGTIWTLTPYQETVDAAKEEIKEVLNER